MSALLEISRHVIQRLDDETLRAMIARLCRAELYAAGLPVSAVQAGGPQDASDGGVDVRVALAGAASGLDFIPRPQTVFQAKASKMPANKLAGEMAPGGRIKASIREVLSQGGAYVVVASKDSLTDKSLLARLAAMRATVAAEGLPVDGGLDFVDSDRLADWINCHPGVALWLREHLGEPLHGWRAHGAWTLAGADGRFLVDEQPRVEAPGDRGIRQLTVPQTLADLRAKLREPGQAIRLVGLSGTGKTRLVQALFEEGQADEDLPPHLAIYADAGEDLQPPPVEMLRRLAAQGRPAVLVVDNCNPEAHRALQTALAVQAGRVSLLTVEYDIEGGEAEEALVYRLSATTPELLDRLLELRHPTLGHGVRRQIVDLSEGNLRVAFALASAAKRTGGLSGLSDADLFRRLFWQRRQPDAGLEHAAQVLALVYSFNAEEPEDSQADHEFARLARLAGCSTAELRRHLGTLWRRGLAQRRGPWRAILPHALANHLAARGLEAVSDKAIWRELRQHERLSLSFARRLSALDRSAEAQALVERWFQEAPGMAVFNERSMQGREFVMRLAPVRPDLALVRLEELTTVEGEGLLGEHWILCRDTAVRLAGQLAYPAGDFARAAEVLVRLALREGAGDRERPGSLSRQLEVLFRPVASGTEADAAQRLALLAGLLAAPDPRRQRLALAVLQTALAVRWSGSVPETFGTRVRGEGWRPRSDADWRAWYGGVLQLIAHQLQAKHPLAAALADLVADAVVSLARELTLLPVLEQFASEIGHLPAALHLWRGIAAALIQGRGEAEEADPAWRERLTAMEFVLRPQTLEARIEALVCVIPHSRTDLLSLEEMEAHRVGGRPRSGRYCEMLAELGRELAARLHDPVIPDRLVGSASPGYTTQLLGRRVAENSGALAEDWGALIDCYAAVSPEVRDAGFIRGFFDGLQARDAALGERLLDECLAHAGLADLCVELHTVKTVTEAGAARLISLAAGRQVSAAKFEWLKFGMLLDGISSSSHATLLRAVQRLPGGLRVAIELHGMRLHGLGDRARGDIEACRLCVELLLKVDASAQTDEALSRVDDLAELALASAEGDAVAAHLCAVLTQAGTGQHGPLNYGAERLLRRVFEFHPVTALNAFFCTDMGRRLDALSHLNADEQHPVRLIPDAILREWVGEAPVHRGPWVAGMIKVFEGDGFSALAGALLQCTPARAQILEAFEHALFPAYVRGGYVDAVQSPLHALRALAKDVAIDVAAWAGSQVGRVEERIAFWANWERDRDQRFE